MRPIFKVGSHDYTQYVESIKPTSNDIDKDGAGRNLLDGLMYRKKIATKGKWSVSFLWLSESIMRQLRTDMNNEYVTIMVLDSLTNTQVTKTGYCSTINEGIQRYVNGQTIYEGVAFDITER
jgi:hypothetical protein